MIGDMPTLTKAAHSHSYYSASDMATPLGVVTGTTGGFVPTAANQFFALNNAVAAAPPMRGARLPLMPPPVPKPKETTMQARRLVQVFIADPDENIPLDKSLLYSGDQKLTDLTDQELFFEIDMKSILEKHNALRVTLINKKVKERTENLEPVKIRDLRMVVVDVATFS